MIALGGNCRRLGPSSVRASLGKGGKGGKPGACQADKNLQIFFPYGFPEQTAEPDTAMKRPWAIIRLSALGDALLTTGVLAYWHAARGMTFHVLTRKALAPLFESHPAVERITALDAGLLTPAGLWRTARALSPACAGLIDLHANLRSRMLGLFWHGRVLRYPKFGMERRLFLLTGGRCFRERLESLSVTQRYALALETTPPSPGDLLPTLALRPEEKAWAARALAAFSTPPIALHPFATHAQKAWPAAAWQGLAERLDAEGLPWFVIGQDKTPLELKGRGLSFINKSSLRETAALLSRAAALVTGDSGPMHLASAVGTPVAALFGPTAKAWGFMPQGTQDIVLQKALPCRPCSLHGAKACPRGQECMAGITPDEVMDALHGIRDNASRE